MTRGYMEGSSLGRTLGSPGYLRISTGCNLIEGYEGFSWYQNNWADTYERIFPEKFHKIHMKMVKSLVLNWNVKNITISLLFPLKWLRILHFYNFFWNFGAFSWNSFQSTAHRMNFYVIYPKVPISLKKVPSSQVFFISRIQPSGQHFAEDTIKTHYKLTPGWACVECHP